MDDIDKHTLYHLAQDPRNTRLPAIVKEVNVLSSTIRHRINQLEERDIIKGYHARIKISGVQYWHQLACKM
ncbi:MAG: winged helix-turn-helix transcriptional regulator [Halorientalis sp.]